MRTEIIAIGDEITSGQRLDTNSQWLSRELSRIGARVIWHSAVGDTLDEIAEVYRTALERAECIVSTGGLGPTADDLTRQAIAQAAGVELALDQRQLERIEALFRKRGREMPERNREQAELPVGSKAIDNPNGSAPGVHLEQTSGRRTSHLFALPGVPAEMKEMFRDTVEPAVRGLLGDDIRTLSHRSLKCFGVGESDLEAMLPDLIRRGRDPQVGITVSRATITLRVTAEGRTEEECRAKMQPTIDLIHQSLGTLVFGQEEDELQHAVISRLTALGATLAIADCGSGGRLSTWLREADPAGGHFVGGVVLRDPAQLTDVAFPKGNPADGRSQQSLAVALARHARSWLAADYGLALTPFPEDVDTADTPRYVGMAVEGKNDTISRAANFAGHPDVRGYRAVKQALDLLRLHLIEE